MKTLPDIPNTPRTVRWSDMGEFDQLAERVPAVTALFGSVVGVNDGFVEWCPDDVPPGEQERLAWVWLCNPALDVAILPHATGRLRELIVAYRAGEMSRWWDDVARPERDGGVAGG